MEENNNHLENLKEIKSLMEQSSRFISLSGLTGVFAGIYALLGALVVYLYFGNQFYTPRFLHNLIHRNGLPRWEMMDFFFVVAAIIFFLTLGTGILLSYRKSKKSDQPLWNGAVRRMLINLFLPLGAGGAFCIALLLHGAIYLVAPAVLVFYGLSLLNAGKYTYSEIKLLGVTEIILGLIAAYVPGYGLIFWSIGFGLLHILYGIIMYLKYEKSTNRL